MFSVAASRPRFNTVPDLYHVHHGDIFLPGAGNIVFEPKFSLPISQLIGAATYAGHTPYATQRPPQIIAFKVVPTAGLGGLISGQFITQPLSDAYLSNGSQ
jgi:hypothetical protein